MNINKKQDGKRETNSKAKWGGLNSQILIQIFLMRGKETEDSMTDEERRGGAQQTVAKMVGCI